MNHSCHVFLHNFSDDVLFWDPSLMLWSGITFSTLFEMYFTFRVMYCCWHPCVTMLKDAFLSENSYKRNVSWRDKPLLLQGIWPCYDKVLSMCMIIISNIIWTSLHHLDTRLEGVVHNGRNPLSNVSCSWFVDRCRVSSCLNMQICCFILSKMQF